MNSLSVAIGDDSASDTGRAIRRRMLKNTVMMTASRTTSICSSLIAVPLIIRHLGMAGYGTWEATIAVSGLITSSQSVITGTVLWKTSEAFGRNAHEELNRYARMGLSATILSALVLVPLIWLNSNHVLALLHIDVARLPSISWILPLVLTIAVAGGVNEVLVALIGAHQRLGLASMIQGASLVLSQVLILIGLVLGWDLWSLLAGSVFGLLFSHAALMAVSLRVCRLKTLWPSIPNLADFGSVSRYGIYLVAASAAVALREHTDKIVLATVGNPMLVAQYAIAARVASLVIMAAGFFAVPMIAAVGGLHGVRDWPAIRKTYAVMMTAIPLGLGALVVAIATTYDRFLVLWIAGVPPLVPRLLMIMLFGNFVAVSLTGPGSALCRGVNRLDLEATYAAFSVVANIVLTVVLVHTIGAIGTVVASAISWSTSALLFALLLQRRLALPMTRVALIAPPVAAITVVAIRYAFRTRSPESFSLAAITTLTLTLTGLLVYCLVLRLCGVRVLSDLRTLCQ